MQNPNIPNILIKTEKNVQENRTVVSFDGDLDKLGLESIRQEIDEVAAGLETTYLVFDFSDLNFINSEGIGYIITIHYRLVKLDKSLVIVNASEHVKDVLQVIGVNEMVQLYETMDAFTEAVKH